ncbi:MAG TPA: amidohydrolase family protein [Verrucomicrobiae bacterium]|nr:amidohydrolase family protein [Verrucomicrobiae bacterium]
MILRAKCVLPMDQPPIEDGAVAIEGDTIVAVGKSAEIRAAHSGEVRDLGERVLAPGLINAHCHLDYTRLRGEVEYRGSFTEWILQLVAAKQLHPDKEYVGGIQRGIEWLTRSGTTTIVNIESFPALIDQVVPTKLRVWWCLELMDFNRSEEAKAAATGALEFIATHSVARGGFGFSPHAPYTASGELYRLCAQYAYGRNIPLTTHLAESEEEDEMIRRGTGHMYDYFTLAGRDMSDCKRAGPTQLMSEYGVLGPHCIAAHVNYLTPVEVALLKQSGTHVVHCPKTHRFFNRGMPPLTIWKAQGINVCLGTDSMASNDNLSMLDEMQTLGQMFPHMSAEELLEFATVNAAKALNQGEKLGKIAGGAWADLIAVPLEIAGSDPYEAVVYADKKVSFSMVGGEVVFDEAK